MSIDRRPDYYNQLYNESEEYIKDYKDSEYYELWKKVVELIPPNVAITELGCGPGQLAKMLYDSGVRSYEGFDFSPVAIQMAREQAIPGYEFHVTDLTYYKFTEDDNFFIAMEILEHTRDYRIIDNIGLGKTIIFSVPDFNDPGHVRYFHSINAVVDRYKHCLLFDYIEKVQGWFLARATTV